MNMIGTFLKYLLQGGILLFEHEFPIMYMFIRTSYGKILSRGRETVVLLCDHL
jgi:hypothetical protein